MINSDGGSTDGTPELIRDASFTEADMVQTSHSLRTLHRVVAPYHGLPGKHTALRTVFAAAELTQAKVLVVIDPGGPATTAERVTELIAPDRALRGRVPGAALSPASARRRRSSRSWSARWCAPLYGVALDEPLGAEFACSGRFASHCLEQDIWNHEAAQVRHRSVAAHRGGGRAVHASVRSGGRRPTAAGARTTLREAVQQVVLVADREPSRARVVLAEGRRRRGAAHLGHRPDGDARRRRRGTTRPSPSRRVTTSPRSSRCSRSVLEPAVFARVMDDCRRRRSRLDDELWVRIVYAFAAATQPGRTQRRAPGRHVRAALHVARGGVHVAHRARIPGDACRHDSTRSVRRSNG